MKILQVTNGFFPDTRAGTEQYVFWISSQLQRMGVEVCVLSPTISEEKTYTYKGVKIYRFPIPATPDVKELNGLIPPRGIERYDHYLQKINPDIVHFHSFERGINSYHLMHTSLSGYKTIFTPHLSSLTCPRGDLQLFNKSICDGKIMLQRCMACYLSKKNPKSIGIIYHLQGLIINLLICIPWFRRYRPAYNLVKFRKQEISRLRDYANRTISIASWFNRILIVNGIHSTQHLEQGIFPKSEPVRMAGTAENRKPDHSNSTNLKLIFVGRLHAMKGLHLLLDALSQLSDNAVELNIIGLLHDANYRDKMIEKAKSLDIKVKWSETLERDQVLNEIQISDILILPSISHEMAPLVILEAFSMRKPVIGSSFPAIAEMINHNVDGLIFENNDAGDLQRNIERIIREKDLLGNLRSNIRNPGSFKDVVIQMHEIYQSTIEE